MESLSMLIVDNDKSYINTLTEILILHNCAVENAENGTKAFDMIKNKFYNIIILDMDLPGIDGLDTINKIKEIHEETTIVMLLNQNMHKLSSLLNKNVTLILHKPYDIMKIIEPIGKIDKKSIALIIDDSEENRKSFFNMMKRDGHKVANAETGSQALELVKANKYNVIIGDFRLPDIDAISLLEKVREIKQTASIIGINAYNLEDTIELVSKKGLNFCFMKPIDIDYFLKDLNVLLGEKNQINLSIKEEMTPPKILVVEDEDGIRETTKDILEEEGYIVQTAPSLPNAIEQIEKENFSLVLSDLSLGDSSGLSLVEPVRRKDSATVFLLITGRGTMETALEAIKKNVDEYILKPIEPGELTHKVRSYIEKQKIKKEKESLLKQLQESNNRLLELVKIDELTGTFNRRYLFEQLHNEMQRAKRQRTSLSLMMCDVDGFKKYNDTNGHLEGDKLLKEIAGILKSSVRQYVDQVFRYGGDEFAIIVPEITKESSLNLAERVVKKVKDNITAKEISLSIGVTNYGMENREISLNELLRDADNKLYEAKKSGGNIAVV